MENQTSREVMNCEHKPGLGFSNTDDVGLRGLVRSKSEACKTAPQSVSAPRETRIVFAVVQQGGCVILLK